MRHLFGSAALSALALALSGCPSDPAVPENVPLADLATTITPTVCDIYTECGGYVVELLFGAGVTCDSTLTARFDDGELPHYEAAVAAGTIIYHGDLVDDCVAQLNAAGCSFGNPFEVCEAIFEGTVADGGACELSEECAGDAYCAIAGACPGTCQARVASGATCTSDAACTGGLDCVGGTCRAPAGAGAACEGTTGVTCSGVGLTCIGSEGTTAGVCTDWDDVFMGALGEVCDAPNQDLCDEGLSCAFEGVGAGGPTFRCVARVAAGAECTIALPDECPADQYCAGTDIASGDTMGTCSPLPTAGAACTPALPIPRCANGFFCSADGAGAATCEALGRNGASCTRDGTCASGACVGGTCAPGEPGDCPDPA